jgi:uncharacterized protein YndB with AHSA1/START domain
MSSTLAEKHGIITEAGTVVFERILPGPIERVWEYLTDSEKRGRWLASGPMEPRVGGKAELFFKNCDLSPVKEPTPERFKATDQGFTTLCEITEWQKPYRLSYLFGNDGSEVTFELKARGPEVVLTLTHRKLPNREMSLNFSGGWHTHLGILVDHLAGETPRPFWSTFLGHYKEYEARIPD